MTKVDLRKAQQQQDSLHYITAMDYTSEALDGYAILVGFSSGEGNFGHSCGCDMDWGCINSWISF